MSEKTVAIESIFVIPRNQFYFSYRINEGVVHTIKKENAFRYLIQYVSKKNYVILADYLSRFLPFIILVKDDTVVELKKQDLDIAFYRQQIENEIFSVLGKSFIERPPREERNEKKVSRIIEKFFRS